MAVRLPGKGMFHNLIVLQPSSHKACLKDCAQVEQFYPASRFCLYRTRSIDFPSYTMISNNYFNKDWAGNRRVKNVVMVLEWVPSASKLSWMEAATSDLPPDRAALFARAFRYFDIWVC